MKTTDSITLDFNAKTLDYIVNCIAQRPYAECAAVLNDIQAQVNAQQNETRLPIIGNGADPVTEVSAH